MQDGWYVDRKLVSLVVFRTHSLTTVASSQFTMVVNYVQTFHMYLLAWQPFFYWKTITKKWRKKSVVWNSLKESFFKFQYCHNSLVLLSQIPTLCPNYYDCHPHNTLFTILQLQMNWKWVFYMIIYTHHTYICSQPYLIFLGVAL